MTFALSAQALQGVSFSGAVAGALACFLVFAGAGPAAFTALAVLFLMTWTSTRLGYHRKHELGVAEQRGGRNGWQVSSNLAVAALSSLFFGMTGDHAWLVAATAALAEAATDTVASEIGQTYGKNAILITTGESVASGTDGGITWIGTLYGVLAGLIIVIVAVVSGILPRVQFWIPATAGVVGMLADSVLGATFQRRGWVSNEAVNLWGTLAAAALAYTLVVVSSL